MISHLVRELILPPCSLLALQALGFALRHRRPRLAMACLALSAGLLYLLSVPLISLALTRTTQRCSPATEQQVRAFHPDAIVVLGAGVDYDAAEYGGRTVPSAASLKRIAYGAYLAKEIGVPILTTGGFGDSPEDSEGQAAAWQLQQQGFTDVLIEGQSRNTRENAIFSKEIADSHEIKRVVLVTQASHAARAESAFHDAGFQVMVAPTGFRSRQPWERGFLMIVPTHSHFDESCRALRAHLAQLYELLRGSR